MPRSRVRTSRNMFLALFGGGNASSSGGGGNSSPTRGGKRASSPMRRTRSPRLSSEDLRRRERLSRLAIPLPDTAVVFFRDMCAEHRETFAAFPLDDDECRDFVLGPAEEEHIAAAKEAIPQLAQCEKLACSGALSAHALTRPQFWYVYFTLLRPFKQDESRSRSSSASRQQRQQQQGIELPHIAIPQALSLVPLCPTDGYAACALQCPFELGTVAATAFVQRALRKAVAARAFMDRRSELGGKIKDDIIHKCPKGTRTKTWTYLLGCAPYNLRDPACFDDAIKELTTREQEQGQQQQEDTSAATAAATPSSATTAVTMKTTETTTAAETPAQVEEPPLFGAEGVFSKKDYAELPGMETAESRGWTAWGRVLRLLAMEWGRDAPLVFVPDFVALLVFVLGDAALAYVGASLVLVDSALHSTTFAMTPSIESVWMDLLESCVSTRVPRLAAHMKTLWLDVSSFARGWFERLFVGAVPLATALRFCDCLLCDGAPALFRIALSILQRFEDRLLGCATADALVRTLAALTRTVTDPDEIIAIAYTMPLDRGLFPANGSDHSHAICPTDAVAEAARLAEAQRTASPYTECSPTTPYDALAPAAATGSGAATGAAAAAAVGKGQTPPPPPLLVPQTPTPDGCFDDERYTGNPSGLLTAHQFAQLNRWLPARFSILEPTLLFTTAKDGFSLENMMRHVEGNSPLIVVVETTEHNVFGCFVPGQLYTSGEHFYGTGEAFLFTFAPKPTVYEWRKGRNQFFFMVHNKTIAIGGGGEGPGLWIDGELNNGQSHRSATFCNAPLNNGESDFVVLALEVFTFNEDD